MLQIFVELVQDEEFYFHPVIYRRLRAGCPICVVGPAVEAKAAQTELSGPEACEGWKWLNVSLYDIGSTHTHYKWKEVHAIVGVPDKLRFKMPNYITVDQGHVASPTTVALLGFLLNGLGLCPKNSDATEVAEVPGDLVWILICTSLPGLPFQCSALTELVSVGVLFTGPKSGFRDYIEQVGNMYASGDLYVVKWDRWFRSLFNGYPVAVQKPRDGESDEEEALVEEEGSTPPKKATPRKVKREEESESESEVEQVGGGDGQKKKKKQKPDTATHKEEKAERSKPKPKAGVTPFTGRVRAAAKK